jgi:site-specific recombinase XerD
MSGLIPEQPESQQQRPPDPLAQSIQQISESTGQSELERLYASANLGEVQRRVLYVDMAIVELFQDGEMGNILVKAIDSWVDYMKSRGKSEHTTLTYLTHILYLFRFLAAKNLNVLQLDPADAEGMVRWLPSDISPVTKNTAVYAAKSFYKNLVRFGRDITGTQVIGSPFESIEGVKSDQRLPRPLTKEQYTAIYDIILEMRTNTNLKINLRFLADYEVNAFVFLMNSGIRSSELYDIQAGDFHDDTDGNLVCYVTGKGRKERMTVVKDMYGLFEDYFSEKLFKRKMSVADFLKDALKLATAAPNKQVFVGVTKHVLYDLLKTINTFPKKVLGQEETELTLHQFRHTYATYLRDMGLELDEIRTLLGHASIATTMVYAAPSIGRMFNKLGKVR